MLLIPIGHDRGVSRVPYLTFAVMALCLSLQIYATVTVPSRSEQLERQAAIQKLEGRLWNKHRRAYLREQTPNLASEPQNAAQMRAMAKRWFGLRRQFKQDLAAGKVTDPSDPLYRQWLALQETDDGGESILAYGYQPGSSAWYTLVTYAFLHGGWLHLIGNMLFLWLCGCNMEDRWGKGFWLSLYLAGAVVAALSFAMARGWHTDQPLVGASGAIAAAMGAFLIVHHGAYIRLFWWYWGRSGTFEMRAYWALPLWFGQQLLGLAVEGPLVSVAYSAHVGGFAFGAAFALAMKASGIDGRILAATEARETVFREHPLFEQALARLEAGDEQGAEAGLQALLEAKPDHLEGTLELARLYLARQEPPAGLGALAGQAVVLAKRVGAVSPAIQLVRELRDRAPEQDIGPRALFALAEALEPTDARGAVQAFEELRQRHPDDMMVPKAMLKSAALHAQSLHEPQEAEALLDAVATRYAGTPYADRAELLRAELQQQSRALAIGNFSKS